VFLVTAATGQQGGATARALLADGRTTRVLVRDPDSAAAKALAAAGAEMVVGDLDDPASLRAACTGARAVFSMQSPVWGATGMDSETERGRGSNLVEAALASGVETFVHSSVSGVGHHREVAGWAEGEWSAFEDYWENKLFTCDLVRNAGFQSFTLVLPSTFMNHQMFDPANFVENRLLTVIAADKLIPLIAVEDIGKASAAAMTDPDRFNGVDLDLAGDLLTMNQVVEVMSRVDGQHYEAVSASIDEAVAAGMNPMQARGVSFQNVLTMPARPEIARSYGLELLDWESYLRQTRSG
jgi:uncharacterized protein YbjT (DUF2867 family)